MSPIASPTACRRISSSFLRFIARDALGSLALLILLVSSAEAGSCPAPDTLGTYRTVAVDASTPRLGLRSFPQTLPLADKEIVLTFDDGPNPEPTRRVLAALAAECVKATFFMVGKDVIAYPDLARKVIADGHSVGNHTWSHANLAKVPRGVALDEIDRGFAAIKKVLGIDTPFFRFPYFDSTPAELDLLQSRGDIVFGADFWASDWLKMTPAEEYNLIIARLEAARHGIILFHDAQPRTAAMLPDFLRYLREHHYRVVHIVPAPRPAKPGSAPRAEKQAGMERAAR